MPPAEPAADTDEHLCRVDGTPLCWRWVCTIAIAHQNAAIRRNDCKDERRRIFKRRSRVTQLTQVLLSTNTVVCARAQVYLLQPGYKRRDNLRPLS